MAGVLRRRRLPAPPPLAPVITLRPLHEAPPAPPSPDSRTDPTVFDWGSAGEDPRLLLVDESVLRYCLHHLRGDQHPMYEVAHGEAIAALRDALGIRRRT